MFNCSAPVVVPPGAVPLSLLVVSYSGAWLFIPSICYIVDSIYNSDKQQESVFKLGLKRHNRFNASALTINFLSIYYRLLDLNY